MLASVALATLLVLQAPSPKAPAGADVLFSGKAAEIGANWFKRYTKDPGAWTFENGVMSGNGVDLTSRKEYGDVQVHVEFRCPTTGGSGNAGVGLMGRYEIQIYDSFNKPIAKNGNGSMYSQFGARVEASKPVGQWQTFDIMFRAPRFDFDGKVTESARATVFLNGVLIHNNESFTGMTGIQYSEYASEAKKGPLVLQGDHDPVSFRNVWVLPVDRS
jgi:hypothetical protein